MITGDQWKKPGGLGDRFLQMSAIEEDEKLKIWRDILKKYGG